LSAANADFHRGFRNVIQTEREADLAALACTQTDPLEAAKIASHASSLWALESFSEIGSR
jgi:hypothetical protein